MKTLAQELGITEFPFEQYTCDIDPNCEFDLITYSEEENGYYDKWEYDNRGNVIVYSNSEGYSKKFEWCEDIEHGDFIIYEEDSKGEIIDNRNNIEQLRTENAR